MSEADLRLTYAHIAALEGKEEWRVLLAAIERREQAQKDKALKAMLADSAFDQRDADFIRGYLKALDWVRDQPRSARVQYNILAKHNRKEVNG